MISTSQNCETKAGVVSETETKRFSWEMWTYCGRKKIGFIISDPWKYGKGYCCLPVPDSRYSSEMKVTQEHLQHVRIMFELHNHPKHWISPMWWEVMFSLLLHRLQVYPGETLRLSCWVHVEQTFLPSNRTYSLCSNSVNCCWWETHTGLYGGPSRTWTVCVCS